MGEMLIDMKIMEQVIVDLKAWWVAAVYGKGPEVRMCLIFGRNGQPGWLQQNHGGKVLGDEVRVVTGPDYRALCAVTKVWFYSRKVEMITGLLAKKWVKLEKQFFGRDSVNMMRWALKLDKKWGKHWDVHYQLQAWRMACVDVQARWLWGWAEQKALYYHSQKVKTAHLPINWVVASWCGISVHQLLGHEGTGYW